MKYEWLLGLGLAAVAACGAPSARTGPSIAASPPRREKQIKTEASPPPAIAEDAESNLIRSARAAVDAAPAGPCHDQAALLQRFLVASKAPLREAFARQAALAFSLLAATGKSCREADMDLGVTPDSAPTVAIRMLTFEDSPTSSDAKPTSAPAATLLEWALMSRPEARATYVAAARASSGTLSPALAARLAFVEAMADKDSSSTAVASAQARLASLGLILDVFTAYLIRDGALATAHRQSDRLALLQEAERLGGHRYTDPADFACNARQNPYDSAHSTAVPAAQPQLFTASPTEKCAISAETSVSAKPA